MTSNNHEEYFKEYLVDTLKLCAQTIIDNAEEIIGNYMFTGDLEVRIDMCTNKSECNPPDIIINKDYLPDMKQYVKIYDKMKEKERNIKYVASSESFYPPEATNSVTGEIVK